jgi:hypothetical protein
MAVTTRDSVPSIKKKVTDHPRHFVDYAERRETAHSATHEEVGHGET